MTYDSPQRGGGEYIRSQWTASRPFVALINKAAIQAGIQVRWLSDDWIAQLQKAGQVRYIYGSCFPLNNAGASHVAADKVATSIVLREAGVPATAHHLVRFPPSGEVEGAADRALACVQPPMVVKPNEESGGVDVHKAESYEEARSIIERLATRYISLAVSPFESIISEHRVVIMDDEPQLCYEKQIYPGTDWRHNLGYGATAAIEKSPETVRELTDIAIPAIRAVGGRFMSVDVILTPSGLRIIEINGGVTLDRFASQSQSHEVIAAEIYRKAIVRCFL